MAEYAALMFVLLVMVAIFGTWQPGFLSAARFTQIANQNAGLMVIAAGMTLVLITGGIDLSVGSVMAFCGSLIGVAMVQWGWPLWMAAPLAISAGLVCGVINGAVSVAWNIPSFIVTLGMLQIARGGSFLVSGSKTQYIGSQITWVGAPLPHVGVSPAVVVAVTLVIVGQVVLTRTIFGRFMIAVGTNEQAVRLSGIDPRPTKLAVFALLGALSGLGSVFFASTLAASDANAGVGLELSAIAAVVIGGTSLMGGRGSVISTFLGVLIIAVLESGLASVSASEHTKRVVTGLVIVLAVIADAYRDRFAGRQWTVITRWLTRR
jgi:ribose transport system permease protein